MIQRLMDVCENASTKKVDFCALVFKFLQIFFNPEDNIVTDYCVDELANIANQVVDIVINQVQYRTHTFLL